MKCDETKHDWTVLEYARQKAQEAVGNWRSFESFGWHDRPEDADRWIIAYTRNRDSGILEQTNAATIRQNLRDLLDQDDPDVREEHHGHWGVGWVDGYSFRPLDGDGDLTEAWVRYCHDMVALERYPILDELAYSEAEYDATLENIRLAAPHRREGVPDGWAVEVWRWLADHEDRELECGDDGVYLNRESLWRALAALGYLDLEDLRGDDLWAARRARLQYLLDHRQDLTVQEEREADGLQWVLQQHDRERDGQLPLPIRPA